MRMRLLVLGIICWVAIGMTSSSGYAEETSGARDLLLNGDFAKQEGGFPIGWKSGGNSYSREEGSTMEVVYDEEMPFAEGFPVIKITKYSPPDAKGPFRFTSEPFPIEHGKKYKFSIWLRADAPLTVHFTFDGGSGELAKKLGKDYRHWWHRPEAEATLEEQWKEYSVTARIPGPGDSGYCSEMKKVWVRISFENGTYWAAKASVVEVKE